MKEYKIHIVSFDDWEAVYYLSKKVSEDHSISTKEVLQILTNKDVKPDEVRFVYASEESILHCESVGNTPDLLSELTFQ